MRRKRPGLAPSGIESDGPRPGRKKSFRLRAPIPIASNPAAVVTSASSPKSSVQPRIRVVIDCITTYAELASKGTGGPVDQERERRPPDRRKDRVVQARVPRDLASTLEREARRRRLTVSHLIRNVLEDTFQLVDDVVANVDEIVNDSVELARRGGRGPLGSRGARRDGRDGAPADGGGARRPARARLRLEPGRREPGGSLLALRGRDRARRRRLH